jgi:hypothetical protein
MGIGDEIPILHNSGAVPKLILGADAVLHLDDGKYALLEFKFRQLNLCEVALAPFSFLSCVFHELF